MDSEDSAKMQSYLASRQGKGFSINKPENPMNIEKNLAE